jgi:hypothetical protein
MSVMEIKERIDGRNPAASGALRMAEAGLLSACGFITAIRRIP